MTQPDLPTPVVPATLLTRLRAEVDALDVDRQLAETLLEEAVERLHVVGPAEGGADGAAAVPVDAAVALSIALLEVLDEDAGTIEQRRQRLAEQSGRLERARDELAATGVGDGVSIRQTLGALRGRALRRSGRP